MNQRGSALLGTVVLGVVALALATWYLQWSRLRAQSSVIDSARKQAVSNAETGFDDVLQQLQLTQDTTTMRLVGELPKGHFEASVIPDTGTIPVLSIAVTGYCELDGASAVGRPAPHASVSSQVLVAPVGFFTIATPGLLRIAPGASIAGTLYGRDLWFEEGKWGPTTQVGRAVYNRASYGHEKNPESAPTYVEFAPPFKGAQQVAYPIRFPTPGPTLRNYYRSRTKAVYDDGALSAEFPPPLNATVDQSGIYFYGSDVEIARRAPLSIVKPTYIYSTGSVTIHHSVIGDAGGWLVVLAEKDIIISSEEQPMLVVGTYVARGKILTVARAASHGSDDDDDSGLRVYGTLLAGAGFDLGSKWGKRQYFNGMAPDVNLPCFTQILDYRITQ